MTEERPNYIRNGTLRWMVEECILGGIPEQEPATSSAWAEKNVGLPGSARSEKFEASITPWIIEPLESVGGG